MDEPTSPEPRRWYQGELGNMKRAVSKEIHPQMSPAFKARWAAWEEAEREKQKKTEERPSV